MTKVDKGTRLGNFIVDTLVLLITIVLLTVIIYFFYPRIADNNSIAFDILFSIVFFSYYFLFEFFTGKTIGKMLTKTIVVDKNGNRPKVLNLIVRTLIRLVPIEGLSFLFGNFGLHDLISKTTVIKIEKHNIATT